MREVTITIKGKKTISPLFYRRTEEPQKYRVFLGVRHIGEVYCRDGRVDHVKRGLIFGTKEVPRWFAAAPNGDVIGEVFPYTEGFATRREATIELIEKVFEVRRDPRRLS
jgi:hypothetical protein